MSTNFERALDLADHIAEVDESPSELVKQLRDAGLLAPDLPEPTTIENSKPTWELGSYFDDVTIFEGWVLIGVNSTIGVTLDLDEAEALAHAILAAIKHQKENRHES